VLALAALHTLVDQPLGLVVHPHAPIIARQADGFARQLDKPR
jgi:hypothetical protein